MPAYNFQHRFAVKVGSGAKRHTIRAPRKDGKRPQVGQPFRAYTGMRTKNCEPILFTHISRVQAVNIAEDGAVYVDGQRLKVEDADKLAVADGFTSVTEFFEFFRDTYGLPFAGDLIHWEFTTGRAPLPNRAA
jgi:hypothetical protein